MWTWILTLSVHPISNPLKGSSAGNRSEGIFAAKVIPKPMPTWKIGWPEPSKDSRFPKANPLTFMIL